MRFWPVFHGTSTVRQIPTSSSWWAPWRAVAAEYRLFVVGSTAPLVSSRVAGPHQLAIPYSSF